jgi:23S rRNA (pseudouridine1915-N3)-methyltransferase
MSSEELAAWLQKKMNSGIKTLSFLVGGSYGVTPELRQRANETLAFSRMTFTHDMIRLIIAEQVYRSFTIIRGEKYHH